MKILITGNQGYIGPVLIKQLRKTHPDSKLVGLDIGFFAHCLTAVDKLSDTQLDQQLYVDVRNIRKQHLEGCDAVVHLAAISNDPMGKIFAKVTDEINCQSSIKIAKLAKEAGVRNYVFASSCSVYGAAEGRPRKEDDPLNPLTAYAKSKIGAENGIRDLAADDFIVTCLRFATACGFSDRTRLDLVLNDFVAGAVSDSEISILSDGTPWRPLIHIGDMSLAIDWAIERETDNGGVFLTVNAGSDEWNYQVKDLAKVVARVVPGTKVSVNKDAVPDKRSYQVDFGKFRELAPNHQPRIGLEEAVLGLKQGLKKMHFCDSNFRNSKLIRLNVLNGYIEDGQLSADLEWASK